ncbi:hypothetical protein [Kitasatospora mediocidica]|uniref:hypothetical protein n=1 Tax=Kitasatospora mediocidica TaxID=58352 RepID=UPI00055FCB5D|nr:hypothetical protein [Kitasatospora mediocidica]
MPGSPGDICALMARTITAIQKSILADGRTVEAAQTHLTALQNSPNPDPAAVATAKAVLQAAEDTLTSDQNALEAWTEEYEADCPQAG